MKIARDYEGQKVFVGIDVHKRTYAVCCVHDGTIVHKFSTKAEPIELASSITEWFSGAEIHSVYEAGFAGLSLHRQLAQRGMSIGRINTFRRVTASQCFASPSSSQPLLSMHINKAKHKNLCKQVIYAHN